MAEPPVVTPPEMPVWTGRRAQRLGEVIGEEALDRQAALIARALRAPAAVVSLVEEDGRVVSGRVGLREPFASRRDLPVRIDFWPNGAGGADVVVVPCAAGDAGVRDDPVVSALGARACLAIPLVAADGHVLGDICVIDEHERPWTGDEIALLRDLAAAATTELALRRELARHRQTEEQLLRGTLHDGLTGLPNRSLFMDRLAQALRRARRNPDIRFAVLYLDLDRFKVVNDSLGHLAGDELLVAVSRRIQATLRSEDTVARLSGDEFAVLVEQLDDPGDAARVAERLQAALAAPVNLGGYDVFTSVSIGIVLNSANLEQPSYLLRSADMAMHRAKTAGGARYEMFDRAMHAAALSRLQVETDLRRALERDELRLHFQPVVSLDSGAIADLEALVRWEHPERGLVPPGEFIPVAEETGLIVPIGRWVLAEAAKQVRDWQRRFPRPWPLAVGVNLSVRQFGQSDLVAQVAAVLQDTGLPPACLKLELTESAIIDTAGAGARVLAQLKALGVQLYLDDFGTGYSSLNYLHRLPLDAIKIDRSFVSSMETEERSFQLVRTIVRLARSIGLAAVAEGVETDAQLTALRKLEADYAQGFLLSHPLAPAKIDELLQREPRW